MINLKNELSYCSFIEIWVGKNPDTAGSEEVSNGF